MAFDVEAARKSGYSDEEILAHLTESRKFDIAGARKSGYSDAEIIQHLATTPPPSGKPGILKEVGDALVQGAKGLPAGLGKRIAQGKRAWHEYQSELDAAEASDPHASTEDRAAAAARLAEQQASAEEMQGVETAVDADLAKLQPEYEQGVAGKIASSLPMGAVDLATGIAAGAAAPAFFFGASTLDAKSEIEQHNRENPNDQVDKKWAVIDGIASATMDKLGIDELLATRLRASSHITKFLRAAAAEGGTEGLEQAVNSIRQKLTTRENMTWGEWGEDMLVSMGAGAALGGPVGAFSKSDPKVREAAAAIESEQGGRNLAKEMGLDPDEPIYPPGTPPESRTGAYDAMLSRLATEQANAPESAAQATETGVPAGLAPSADMYKPSPTIINGRVARADGTTGERVTEEPAQGERLGKEPGLTNAELTGFDARNMPASEPGLDAGVQNTLSDKDILAALGPELQPEPAASTNASTAPAAAPAAPKTPAAPKVKPLREQTPEELEVTSAALDAERLRLENKAKKAASDAEHQADVEEARRIHRLKLATDALHQQRVTERGIARNDIAALRAKLVAQDGEARAQTVQKIRTLETQYGLRQSHIPGVDKPVAAAPAAQPAAPAKNPEEVAASLSERDAAIARINAAHAKAAPQAPSTVEQPAASSGVKEMDPAVVEPKDIARRDAEMAIRKKKGGERVKWSESARARKAIKEAQISEPARKLFTAVLDQYLKSGGQVATYDAAPTKRSGLFRQAADQNIPNVLAFSRQSPPQVVLHELIHAAHRIQNDPQVNKTAKETHAAIVAFLAEGGPAAFDARIQDWVRENSAPAWATKAIQHALKNDSELLAALADPVTAKFVTDMAMLANKQGDPTVLEKLTELIKALLNRVVTSVGFVEARPSETQIEAAARDLLFAYARLTPADIFGNTQASTQAQAEPAASPAPEAKAEAPRAPRRRVVTPPKKAEPAVRVDKDGQALTEKQVKNEELDVYEAEQKLKQELEEKGQQEAVTLKGTPLAALWDSNGKPVAVDMQALPKAWNSFVVSMLGKGYLKRTADGKLKLARSQEEIMARAQVEGLVTAAVIEEEHQNAKGETYKVERVVVQEAPEKSPEPSRQAKGEREEDTPGEAAMKELNAKAAEKASAGLAESVRQIKEQLKAVELARITESSAKRQKVLAAEQKKGAALASRIDKTLAKIVTVLKDVDHATAERISSALTAANASLENGVISVEQYAWLVNEAAGMVGLANALKIAGKKAKGAKVKAAEATRDTEDRLKREIHRERMLYSGLAGVAQQLATNLEYGALLMRRNVIAFKAWSKAMVEFGGPVALQNLRSLYVDSAALAGLKKGEYDDPLTVQQYLEKNYPLTLPKPKDAPLLELGKEKGAHAVRVLKEQLRSRGKLDEQSYKLKEVRDGQIAAILKSMEFTLHDYKAAVKEAYGKEPSEAQLNALNVALQMNPAKILSDPLVAASIPSARLRNVIADMRKSIDIMTAHLKAAGVLEGELAIVADKNLGTYLHRGYEIFDNPSFKPSPAARERLHAFLKAENPGLTDAEIAKHIDTLEFHPHSAGLRDTAGGSFKKRVLGMKNVDTLKKREDLPEALRAFWGEYADPKMNFVSTLTNMAFLAGNHRFLSDVRRLALESGMAGDFDKAAGRVVQVPNSEGLEPLAGLYTTQEFLDGLKEAAELQDPHVHHWMTQALIDLAATLNGGAKYSKTILSHVTHIRNLISNIGFAVANGHTGALLQGKLDVADAFRLTFNPKSAEDRAAFVEMVRLGVFGESPSANELAELRRDLARSPGKFGKALARGVESSSRLFQVAEHLYAAEDNVWKAIHFKGELNRYLPVMKKKHPRLSENQVMQKAMRKAAEVVRNTHPTYSKNPPFVRSLRKFPVLAPFVSFPSEVIRTSLNMVVLAGQELNDPDTRSIGVRRALGIAAAIGFAPVMHELTKWLAKISDDEEEALRIMGPEYNENALFVYLGKDEQGMPRTIDLSNIDPFAYLKKPLVAAVRELLAGKGGVAAGTELVKELAQPFVAPELGTKALMNIINGEDDRGNPLWEETLGDKNLDDFLERTNAFTDQLLGIRFDRFAGDKTLLQNTAALLSNGSGALMPGSVTSLRRLAMAYSGDVNESGKQYHPVDETAAFFLGQRTQYSDVKQQMLSKALSAKPIINQIGPALRETFRKGTSHEQKLAAIERADAVTQRNYAEFLRYRDAAYTLGLTEEDLVQMLAKVMSKDDVFVLLQGDTPEWTNRRLLRTRILEGEGAYTPGGLDGDPETRQ